MSHIPLGAGTSFILEDVDDYEERLAQFIHKVESLPFPTYAPALENYPGCKLEIRQLKGDHEYGIITQYNVSTDKTTVKFLAFKEQDWMLAFKD